MLYPLRFQPIYKKVLWGGRRLTLLGHALPEGEPIGEAWVVSDQGDNLSRVANGPLAGATLRALMREKSEELLGKPELAGRASDGQFPSLARPANSLRFPLLLKFIDAHAPLSVQVHPSDRHTALLPPGDCGKTEAWVILHAEPDSRIYAGLKPGVGPEPFQQALQANRIEECLHWFTPKPGDCVFIPAGTVHAIGAGVVLFEVQQTSDVTFRLHDWDRVDPKTGQPRQLHVAESLACIDYASGPRDPVRPIVENATPVAREQLVACDYFFLRRVQGEQPFAIETGDRCRILVGIAGQVKIDCGTAATGLPDGGVYPLGQGEVLLLPASLPSCRCCPQGAATLLEIALPGRSESQFDGTRSVPAT